MTCQEGEIKTEKTSTLKIQSEVLTRDLFIDEILPLGQKCWDECSEIKGETCSFHGERGFVIQPDVKRYLELADQDTLLTMTARDDEGVLRGYALCIYYMSLHHAPVICANVDTLYVEPEFRACLRRFISNIESEFENRGVVIVGWATSPAGKMYEILKLLGYAPDDVIMEKRLCALQQL